MVSEPLITVPEAIVETFVKQGVRNLNIDIDDVKILEFGGYVENVKVDGKFNKLNVLQELKIVAIDGVFAKKMPKFPKISASVNKLDDGLYRANVAGDLDEFVLSNNDNFIGSLPGANYSIELELDRAVSKLSSISKINFNNLTTSEINGEMEIGFSSEIFTNLGCGFLDCDLSDFKLAYKVNFDDERVTGSANCPESVCRFSELEHLVRTSNTVNIFTTLNEEKVLSPLSSLYLYGAISSGRK